MSDLESRLAALTPRQRAEFERLLKESGQAGPAENLFPLSVFQQGMWFLEQLAPQLTAYNIVFAERLRGPLDIPALQAALADVAERQDLLRWRIEARDGEPYAVCDPPEVFTYGGMLAHVLTFAAHRRTLAIGALHSAGITDLGAGDPMRWVAEAA